MFDFLVSLVQVININEGLHRDVVNYVIVNN